MFQINAQPITLRTRFPRPRYGSSKGRGIGRGRGSRCCPGSGCRWRGRWRVDRWRWGRWPSEAARTIRSSAFKGPPRTLVTVEIPPTRSRRYSPHGRHWASGQILQDRYWGEKRFPHRFLHVSHCLSHRFRVLPHRRFSWKGLRHRSVQKLIGHEGIYISFKEREGKPYLFYSWKPIQEYRMDRICIEMVYLLYKYIGTYNFFNLVMVWVFTWNCSVCTQYRSSYQAFKENGVKQQSLQRWLRNVLRKKIKNFYDCLKFSGP